MKKLLLLAYLFVNILSNHTVLAEEIKLELKYEDNSIPIVTVMREIGFENINIQYSVDKEKQFEKYKIYYENRSYLHDFEALGELLAKLRQFVTYNTYLEIYIQSSGKTTTKVFLIYADYLDFINSYLKDYQFENKVTITNNPEYKAPNLVENSLFLHSDLTIIPSYLLDSKGISVLLNPTFTTFFDNGLFFTVKYSLPIYSQVNSFDFFKNIAYLKPFFSDISFNYGTGITNSDFYSAFKGGYSYDFNSNDFYLSNDSQYLFLEGKLNLGLLSSINYTNKLDYSLLPYIQTFIPPINTFVELGGGKLMNNEMGGVLSIDKELFNFADLKLSAYKGFNSNPDYKISLETTIALGGEKGSLPEPFRFTYPRYLYGNYLYPQNTTFSQIPPYFRVSNYLNKKYPAYLKNNLYYFKYH